MNDSAKSQWIVDALDRHEASLVRYANWILGDIESAREVVQETFLRLCKEQQSRVGTYLAQWLFTVCRNLAFDTRKKETRMTPLGDTEIGVDSRLEQRETAGEIFRMLNGLRSEEHTSELQSHSDLVCRLLLEKKKKKKISEKKK